MDKLEAMLKYVSEHNDFYKKRIAEYGISNPLDITQWPILTRKELQENRYNMFSNGYKSKYFNQQLRRQSSSGSSGIPVSVYWDYRDWYASNMALWRKRMDLYEIKPSDRHIIFTLNAFDTKSDYETVYYIKDSMDTLSVNVSSLQTEEQYTKLINLINEYNPVWLYIQPFILNRIVKIYQTYNFSKPSNLRYVESVGELLTADLRRRATDFFQTPIANMYGSEEMNGIAYGAHEKEMVVLYDNVYLEARTNNGVESNGLGQTIITNLNNHAMPLIRYGQGDVVQLNSENENSVIELIKGRTHDRIVLSNNIEINSFMLFEVIAEVNNQFKDAIIEYSFVYIRSKLLLNCFVQIDDILNEWEKAILAAVNDKLLYRIGYCKDIEISVISSKELFNMNTKHTIKFVE